MSLPFDPRPMSREPTPAVRMVMEGYERLPVPPTAGLSVESSRKRLMDLLAEQPVEEVAMVEDFSIPGPVKDIPVRAYVPEAEGRISVSRRFRLTPMPVSTSSQAASITTSVTR